jgi:predicted dehydrogenase
MGRIFRDDSGMNTHNLTQPLQVALIGFGAAGRIFHAPLLAAVPGLQLACICSRQTEQALAAWPNVRVLASAQQVFDDPQIDVVVIATPNASHYPLALAALQAGKQVVIDKPCCVTLAQAEHLLQVARAQTKVLTVFQNRRLDSDILALQAVIASGKLGRLVHVESHFDRYRPQLPNRWREQNLPGSGLWFDLGAHLVDQTLLLFGVPDDRQLHTACQREGALTNDWFHAVLNYESRHPGLRVVLHASTLVPELGPRWIVHGTQGSFIKYGLDSQEDALKAGRSPNLADLQDWGQDSNPGQILHYAAMAGVQEPVAVRQAAPNLAGCYWQYYANLRDHIRGLAPLMVTPEQVLAVMRLLTL